MSVIQCLSDLQIALPDQDSIRGYAISGLKFNPLVLAEDYAPSLHFDPAAHVIRVGADVAPFLSLDELYGLSVGRRSVNSIDCYVWDRIAELSVSISQVCDLAINAVTTTQLICNTTRNNCAHTGEKCCRNWGLSNPLLMTSCMDMSVAGQALMQSSRPTSLLNSTMSTFRTSSSRR